MRRPRILLAAMSLESGNGGIARVARLTARVLARFAATGDVEARAVTLLDASPATDLGIPVATAAGSRLRFVAAVQSAAFTHSHMMYDSLAAARAHCRLPLVQRPFMAWICGVEVWPNDPSDRLVNVRRSWARRATALVSISNYTRVRAEFPQADVCWLATESDDSVAESPATKPRRVLMMSRVDESYKGHDALVACWPHVVAAVPDAVLTFAGRGPGLERLRKMVSSSPCASHIEVLGFVPDADVDALWRRTAVFAMPSTGEGFGLVYVEAMHYGVPVIATTHDAGQEINADGITGYNVNLRRDGELATRIIELLNDRTLAAQMGAHARERWRASFAFSAFEARFAPLVRKFLER